MQNPVRPQAFREDAKFLYVLLIRTNTIFSRIIHVLTGSRFTHASVGLDVGCEQLYSFARKGTYMPLPAGFVNEQLDSGLIAKCYDCPCAMYKVEITQSAFEELKNRVETMLRDPKKFKYSCIGPILCFFHRPYEHGRNYFCSQFVADVLRETGAVQLHKSPSLYHPNDFTKMEELQLEYEGTIGGLARRCQEMRKDSPAQ